VWWVRRRRTCWVWHHLSRALGGDIGTWDVAVDDDVVVAVDGWLDDDEDLERKAGKVLLGCWRTEVRVLLARESGRVDSY
jgi:hypothetical protein